MQSMLSNKLVSSEKVTFMENEKIITDGKEIAKVLIIDTFNITQANHSDSNFENIRDPTIKVILKYRNHPSTLTIIEKG